MARYYLDEGKTKGEARAALEAFLLSCEPGASAVKWAARLDSAVKYALKNPAVAIGEIDVTAPEMEKIDGLGGRQIRRLAFTLLVLAKYGNAAREGNDSWVNRADSEVMSLANINTSVKRQSAMYGKLREAGLLAFSRVVDNTNVRVCFAEEGEVVMRITDMRNLGYQYLRAHGEPFIVCARCGVVTKEKNPGEGRPQRYCPECASAVRAARGRDAREKVEPRDLAAQGIARK